tara:strand:- start:277 stop:1227 length:951 start_codon:yes stop_codon:yes gene_type:complete
MANATVSRLGQVNTSGDANALFLKVWSGEVLATFQRENKMLGMSSVRTISSGKSAQFPVVGTNSTSYHTPGNEITGTQVKHSEKIINIDDLLISNAFIANIDEAKNHYDVRSIYTSEMGRALANKVDQHLLQLSVLAAQASATITGGNGGTQITDADAKTNAASLISSIFECAQALDEHDIPSEERFCVVPPATYYLLVQNDKILNRDFGAERNGVYADGTVIKVAGVNIVKANTAVTAFTDQSSSISGTNNTYNVDAQNVAAVVFHKSAIGTVKLMDLAMESEYDIRRQGTLMVGKMALGHGILRPESAALIKTA